MKKAKTEKTVKHSWVIRNKDMGEFVENKTHYTKHLDNALLFKTRQDARDFISKWETVDQEKPMKVLFQPSKRVLLTEKNQFLFVFE